MSKLKRTQDEIVTRIKEIEDEDFFGFKTSDLLSALDYEHAKPWLIENATEEAWSKAGNPITDFEKVAVEYMPFAWGKANGFRGLSAARSLCHYQAWLWLMGDNDIWPTLDDYEYYGKDELRRICDFLGLDADQWDDGVRSNDE